MTYGFNSIITVCGNLYQKAVIPAIFVQNINITNQRSISKGSTMIKNNALSIALLQHSWRRDGGRGVKRAGNGIRIYQPNDVAGRVKYCACIAIWAERSVEVNVSCYQASENSAHLEKYLAVTCVAVVALYGTRIGISGGDVSCDASALAGSMSLLCLESKCPDAIYQHLRESSLLAAANSAIKDM